MDAILGKINKLSLPEKTPVLRVFCFQRTMIGVKLIVDKYTPIRYDYYFVYNLLTY